MAIQVQIEGLERLIKKTSPALIGVPLRKFFERAAITVQSKARENAPVDTGRLRSSIAYEIDDAAVPLYAEIGTNVAYAPFMEFGTGLFAEGEGGARGRHWPPGDALEVWTSRHGMASGYAVAAAIGKRGGLKPRRFLRSALKDSIGEIRGFVQKMGDEIGQIWSAR